MNELLELKKIIAKAENIVFLVALVFRLTVAFPTLEGVAAYIPT